MDCCYFILFLVVLGIAIYILVAVVKYNEKKEEKAMSSAKFSSEHMRNGEYGDSSKFREATNSVEHCIRKCYFMEKDERFTEKPVQFEFSKDDDFVWIEKKLADANKLLQEMRHTNQSNIALSKGKIDDSDFVKIKERYYSWLFSVSEEFKNGVGKIS